MLNFAGLPAQSRRRIHADETTLQVLHEPGKKPQSQSYMWLYRTGRLSTAGTEEYPIVLYEYQPGRGAKHPAAFLEGFRGYLHTDGYAGYHKLPSEITVVGCWAHARRKFDEALKSIAKGQSSAKNIRKGLDFCNRLFAIEQHLAILPAEERYTPRLEQAKPVLDELFGWVESQVSLGQRNGISEKPEGLFDELPAGWSAGNQQQSR